MSFGHMNGAQEEFNRIATVMGSCFVSQGLYMIRRAGVSEADVRELVDRNLATLRAEEQSGGGNV